MVQAVCEKRSDFSQVPPLVNNHPMLQDSALIDTQSARSLYESLLVHYGVIQGEDADMGEKSEDEQVKQELEQDGEGSEDIKDTTEHTEAKTGAEPTAEPSAETDSLGPEAKDEATAGQQIPEATSQFLQSNSNSLKSETQIKDSDTPATHQGSGPQSAGADHVANLDKLVGILYMKYTHELLQTIDEDKKEFAEALASIKS